MGNDDPDRQVSHVLFRNVFREHPYRYPIIGHRELFEAISREDLLTYYQARYVPNNMTLVVVGDFHSSELRDEIEKKFGGHSRKDWRFLMFQMNPYSSVFVKIILKEKSMSAVAILPSAYLG